MLSRLRHETTTVVKYLSLLFAFLFLIAACSNAGMAGTTLPDPTATKKESPDVEMETEPSQQPHPTISKITSPIPSLTTVATQASNSLPMTQVPSLPPPSPTPTLGPDGWKKLPIIPEPSERVVEIFQRGLELGNNPNAFSKVGDCGSTPAWFLGDFDRGEKFYNLGNYEYLRPVIQVFQGSFERTSLAARSGFTATSLLTSLWTDLKSCQVNETPLECEYRLHKPVIAFITLGTNDIWLPDQFEPQMRKIIEYSLEQGVIPILATKADNAEGDGRINATIANLALEYDIPLWNFWLAVQPLPDHGLQEDEAHLTWGRNLFDQPENLTKAWPVRNLTALQVLNAVWMKVTGQSE